MRALEWLVLMVALASAASAHSPSLSLASEAVERSGAGRVVGRVTDASGRPIELANVTVVGMPIGVWTDEQGRYVLSGVPAGELQVQVQAFGMPKTIHDVRVGSGETVRLDLALRFDRKVVELPVMEVRDRREIDPRASDTQHRVSGSGLREMLVDRVIDAVSLQPGVVARGDQLSVRGGRPDEVKLRVSGMEVSDPLVSRNPNIGRLAVEEITLRTGASTPSMVARSPGSSMSRPGRAPIAWGERCAGTPIGTVIRPRPSTISIG